jgi:hypothetical protein
MPLVIEYLFEFIFFKIDSLIFVFLREGLMTYKQFIQVLEDDILPSEAERRYFHELS